MPNSPARKGITYFCTDKHGHTYNRFSARHCEPLYHWAALRHVEGDASPLAKNEVSYSESKNGAHKLGAQYGCRTYQVVKVRAYPGRHTTEPSPAGWDKVEA